MKEMLSNLGFLLIFAPFAVSVFSLFLNDVKKYRVFLITFFFLFLVYSVSYFYLVQQNGHQLLIYNKMLRGFLNLKHVLEFDSLNLTFITLNSFSVFLLFLGLGPSETIINRKDISILLIVIGLINLALISKNLLNYFLIIEFASFLYFLLDSKKRILVGFARYRRFYNTLSSLLIIGCLVFFDAILGVYFQTNSFDKQKLAEIAFDENNMGYMCVVFFVLFLAYLKKILMFTSRFHNISNQGDVYGNLFSMFYGTVILSTYIWGFVVHVFPLFYVVIETYKVAILIVLLLLIAQNVLSRNKNESLFLDHQKILQVGLLMVLLGIISGNSVGFSGSIFFLINLNLFTIGIWILNKAFIVNNIAYQDIYLKRNGRRIFNRAYKSLIAFRFILTYIPLSGFGIGIVFVIYSLNEVNVLFSISLIILLLTLIYIAYIKSKNNFCQNSRPGKYDFTGRDFKVLMMVFFIIVLFVFIAPSFFELFKDSIRSSSI